MNVNTYSTLTASSSNAGILQEEHVTTDAADDVSENSYESSIPDIDGNHVSNGSSNDHQSSTTSARNAIADGTEHTSTLSAVATTTTSASNVIAPGTASDRASARTATLDRESPAGPAARSTSGHQNSTISAHNAMAAGTVSDHASAGAKKHSSSSAQRRQTRPHISQVPYVDDDPHAKRRRTNPSILPVEDTPDFTVNEKGKDPWARKWRNKPLIEEWTSVNLTNTPGNFFSYYAVMLKKDKVKEFYLKIEIEYPNKSRNELTNTVCLSTDAANIHFIILRTFRLNQVLYSGVCLNAVIQFCRQLNDIAKVFDITRITYTPYQDEKAVNNYFRDLSIAGFWKKEWISKSSNDFYYYHDV